MVSDARKKMLEKVKAILAKTMDNGCTEEEAMAALAKARELMATYEIDEKELADVTEKAEMFRTEVRDPYEIKLGLSVKVGKFTRCVGVKDRDGVIAFIGKPGDIVFATWLLDTLQRFVMRALREFQKELIKKGAFHSNNLTSASFVVGCTARINEKLAELIPVDWAKNQELILKEMNMGLKGKGRKSGREINQNAAQAGMKAGNSARFDRPVESGGIKRLK